MRGPGAPGGGDLVLMEECCAPCAAAAPCAPKPAPKPEFFTFDKVIMFQRANGSFKPDVLSGISVSEGLARSRLPAHDGLDDDTAFLVWVTIIVLKHLELKEASHKSEWGFIAQKSEKWAESRLSSSKYKEWMDEAEKLLKSL